MEADFFSYLIWFGEECEINYKEKTTFAMSHLSTVVRFTFFRFYIKVIIIPSDLKLVQPKTGFGILDY